MVDMVEMMDSDKRKRIRKIHALLEVLPSTALSDWQQGYIAGCSDPLVDQLEMMEDFVRRTQKVDAS
jgi:hypothetical protein